MRIETLIEKGFRDSTSIEDAEELAQSIPDVLWEWIVERDCYPDGRSLDGSRYPTDLRRCPCDGSMIECAPAWTADEILIVWRNDDSYEDRTWKVERRDWDYYRSTPGD
jgi:hypothetical protein